MGEPPGARWRSQSSRARESGTRPYHGAVRAHYNTALTGVPKRDTSAGEIEG
jgi:hypothetical protein